MNSQIPETLIKKFDEIRRLYNLSDAELFCMCQLAMLISRLEFGPQLTVKLMRALTACWEMAVDEMEKK